MSQEDRNKVRQASVITGEKDAEASRQTDALRKAETQREVQTQRKTDTLWDADVVRPSSDPSADADTAGNEEQVLSEDTAKKSEGDKASSDTEENASDSDTDSEFENTVPAPDFDRIAEQDLEALKREFPTLSSISHIGQLDNAVRYGALRDRGLSPREAFLATNYHRLQGTAYDNRSHLRSAAFKSASGPVGMNATELSAARELFGSLSDAELTSLYRRAVGTAKR